MTAPYYADEQVTLWLGDTLDILRGMPDESVDCVVTSPPYFGLRSYTPDLLVRRSDLTRDERQRFLHEMNKLGLLRNPERYSREEIPAELMDLFQSAEYGAEKTPAQYVETMRAVFAEAKRVLAKDGTCWINVDDSYAYPPGSAGKQGDGQRKGRTFTAEGLPGTRAIPPKNLMLIPERLIIALQDDGWIVRNKAVWHKANAMPESVGDRLATRYENVFLLARSERYLFDLDAIREPHSSERAQRLAGTQPGGQSRMGKASAIGIGDRSGGQSRGDHAATAHPLGRNPGDVWTIPTGKYPDAHFATFPINLPLRCIKAGCKPSGTVLDMFSGSGTTGEAARRLGRRYVGIDLNPAYHDLAVKRFAQGVLDLEAGVA